MYYFNYLSISEDTLNKVLNGLNKWINDYFESILRLKEETMMALRPMQLGERHAKVDKRNIDIESH